MSIERKNPLKRDQALNDATGGQMGEQPRPQPSKPIDDNLNEQRLKAAQKKGRMNQDNKNPIHKLIKDEDVYHLLLQIPEGKTTTYGDLAVALGNPSAARLIGQIVGRNPNPIKVPCHRVVKSDGGLGGYRGGIDKKIELLRKEGVSINNERTAINDFENVRFYPKIINNDE